jgi:electron transport complex protein RnfB
MLNAVIILALSGLIFGAILAFAARKFAVPVDERIQTIRELLPGANCSACGYASCGSYAEDVVFGGAPVNGCKVGGASMVAEIARVMGVQATDDEEPKVAEIMCRGGHSVAPKSYEYSGIFDCKAASLPALQGGPKLCNYGCLGFGTCVRACPFDALYMGDDGIPVVDRDACTGCGKCTASCPRNLIHLVPISKKIHVACSNKDRGPAARKVCKVACIACGACVRACKHDAISLNDNVAEINYSKCTQCGECAAKCPTKCIIEVQVEDATRSGIKTTDIEVA